MLNFIHYIGYVLYSAGVRIIVIVISVILISSASISAQVVDTIPPEVDLIGESAVTTCEGVEYIDEGYQIADNYYTDSADFTVEREGSFSDSSRCFPGLYTLRYKVTDASGNVGYSEYRAILVNPASKYPCDHWGYPCSNGITEPQWPNNFITVYPNPSSGNIVIKTDASLATQQPTIRIFNLLG